MKKYESKIEELEQAYEKAKKPWKKESIRKLINKLKYLQNGDYLGLTKNLGEPKITSERQEEEKYCDTWSTPSSEKDIMDSYNEYKESLQFSENIIVNKINEPDGKYACEFYGWTLEFPNGNTYKTNRGVRCTKHACGGFCHIIEVKDGVAYSEGYTEEHDKLNTMNYQDDPKAYNEAIRNIYDPKLHANFSDLSEVKGKTKLPEGTFKCKAETIKKRLLSKAKNKQHALKMINFYLNRAGKNLTNKSEVMKAKKLIENCRDFSALTNRLKTINFDKNSVDKIEPIYKITNNLKHYNTEEKKKKREKDKTKHKGKSFMDLVNENIEASNEK